MPKQSALGVASFWIVIVGGLVATIMFTVGVRIGNSKPRGFFVQGSTEATLILCAAALGLVVILLGLGLGIAGLFQKDRKRIFAILGILSSLLLPLGVLAVVALGSR